MSRRQRAERAGRAAETACAWLLRLKGYRVLARRYRAGPGELDIVARRGALVAVVEVKARRTYAAAVEAVDSRQRACIEWAAAMFVAEHAELARLAVRFDVMVVLPWRPPVHVEDAWRP